MKGGRCLDPNRLNIMPGTTVSWVNDDTVVHYLQPGLEPVSVAPGSRYSFVFSKTGTWDYKCGTSTIPDNRAQVVVEQDSDERTLEYRSITFLVGPFVLRRDMGIDGWMVFEAPIGTKFRSLRWRAGDSITVDF